MLTESAETSIDVLYTSIAIKKQNIMSFNPFSDDFTQIIMKKVLAACISTCSSACLLFRVGGNIVSQKETERRRDEREKNAFQEYFYMHNRSTREQRFRNKKGEFFVAPKVYGG